jgi:hypothetical protein
MMAFAGAFGGLLVRPGVELVWFAPPAYSADCRPALFDSDEPTIPDVAEHAVNSTPFIGVGRGTGWTKGIAEANNGDNGFNKSAKHYSLQVANELATFTQSRQFGVNQISENSLARRRSPLI